MWFDRLTIPSKVEGFITLSIVEGVSKSAKIGRIVEPLVGTLLLSLGGTHFPASFFARLFVMLSLLKDL